MYELNSLLTMIIHSLSIHHNRVIGSNKCSHDWTKRRDFLRLIEMELKIIDNEECTSHPYAYEEGTITRNMICGVEEEKGNVSMNKIYPLN